MTLVNFIRVACTNRRSGRRRLTDIWQISPLLTTFVRDGTVFYLILFKTIIIAMVLSAFVQGPAAPVANAWMIAMYSFATSRLLLNLREFADQSAGSVVSWEQTLSIQIRPSQTDDEDYENSEIPLQWR
ncbi:hypothetical protein F5887DRAFT_120031 [Amanita rubescens]|nr:hypothetical protein F5887DRAFT_120031 [Amanita rubescens]